jgi:hypothetical protein
MASAAVGSVMGNSETALPSARKKRRSSTLALLTPRCHLIGGALPGSLEGVARLGVAALEPAAEPGEPWIIWVDTDYDEEAVKDAIPGAVAINGKMSPDVKEDLLMGVTEGRIRVLITKPSIAGFGLNWQHCARVAFCGISFSYEKFYQAVRRCYRFRQTRQVDVHIVGADTEAAIESIVARKAGDHEAMKLEMVDAMRRASISAEQLRTYAPTKEARLPAWLINASA